LFFSWGVLFLVGIPNGWQYTVSKPHGQSEGIRRKVQMYVEGS
jgi:hypothetical protein